MLQKTDKIYIAGHRGMVGSAIHRNLLNKGFTNFVTRTSKELDLRNQIEVQEFFRREKPDVVFLAAAKVGGILANNIYRAEFIYDNIMIQSNVIHAAYLNNVKKLLFLGSSCIYPKMAKQPLTEDYLLTNTLEPTNEPYAIAKIAGIKMCDAYRSQYNCDFISVMPTNLYGPNDNYNLKNSHVLPALMRKFIEAKRENKPYVEMWGTGKPMREFMHADDLADACVYLVNHFSEAGFVNIGTGKDIAIIELAKKIKTIVGYDGEIKLDLSKPDGTPRKWLNISKLKSLGWSPKIDLDQGLQMIYDEVKNTVWTDGVEV